MNTVSNPFKDHPNIHILKYRVERRSYKKNQADKVFNKLNRLFGVLLCNKSIFFFYIEY